MLLQLGIFGRLLKRFRSRDEPIPTDDQPIPEQEIFPGTGQEFVDSMAEARKIRIGPARFVDYTNVYAKVVPLYTHPSDVFIPRSRQLVANVEIIGPDNLAREYVVSFRHGEQFNEDRLTRMISAKVKNDYPNLDKASSFVRGATKAINYEYRSYHLFGT